MTPNASRQASGRLPGAANPPPRRTGGRATPATPDRRAPRRCRQARWQGGELAEVGPLDPRPNATLPRHPGVHYVGRHRGSGVFQAPGRLEDPIVGAPALGTRTVPDGQRGRLVQEEQCGVRAWPHERSVLATELEAAGDPATHLPGGSGYGRLCRRAGDASSKHSPGRGPPPSARARGSVGKEIKRHTRGGVGPLLACHRRHGLAAATTGSASATRNDAFSGPDLRRQAHHVLELALLLLQAHALHPGDAAGASGRTCGPTRADRHARA